MRGYDAYLVTFSILIATFAAAATIDLAGVRLKRRRHARLAWLAGGALATLAGVWIVHYGGFATLLPSGPREASSPGALSPVPLIGLGGIAALIVFGMVFVGAAIDRSRLRNREWTVLQGELRFRALVEQSPEAIILHDGGRLVYANQAAALVLGFDDAAALVGTSLLDYVHADSRAPAATRLEAGDAEAFRGETIEYRLLHRDGRVLDVAVRSVPGSFDGRAVVQTHIRDITERKALEQQLVHQAFHDALTGLANRALFRDRVEHALSRAARRGSRPAVLFLDLDNFKAVNDGLGHACGDALLAAVGARLVGALRDSDTCARLGGDEFAVLIEEPGGSRDIAADAAHVAERILAVLQAPIEIERAPVVAGVSIGIAIARDGDHADDLLRNADLAMYRAKAHGKGRYEVFEPAMHHAVRQRIEMETELRSAVEWCAFDADPDPASPFVIHYQPITALETGRPSGFEALVRWRHPERGLVPPLEFIPVAEETGLILPLGRWILGAACRQLVRWREQEPAGTEEALSLTVNISAVQLMRPELTADVGHALASAGLPAEALVLELTESMLVEDSTATLERLRALKALGVRIAIDDFGTGFSSLSYLERFPVDLLKIDRTFINKIGGAADSRDDSALARAVLGLGGALDMQVVAEGIETEAQWTRLLELGCDLGQGYYFARPLPPEEIERNGRAPMRPATPAA